MSERVEALKEAAQIVADCAEQGLGLESARRSILREASAGETEGQAMCDCARKHVGIGCGDVGCHCHEGRDAERETLLSEREQGQIIEALDHAPWHYTEFGVLCSCGLPMDSDETCQTIRNALAAVEALLTARSTADREAIERVRDLLDAYDAETADWSSHERHQQLASDVRAVANAYIGDPS